MPRDFSLARSSVCHWENTIHNSNGLCLASDEVPKLHIHSDEAGKRKGAMPWLSSTLLSEKLSTYSTVPNRLTSEQAVSLLPSFHIVDELFSILHPIALEKENDIRIKNTYSTFFYHNWVFVPYQKGCFSSMLVSKKKYSKSVFLVHLSSRQIDLASQFYNTRV